MNPADRGAAGRFPCRVRLSVDSAWVARQPFVVFVLQEQHGVTIFELFGAKGLTIGDISAMFTSSKRSLSTTQKTALPETQDLQVHLAGESGGQDHVLT